ncbi:MAG: sigma-E factor negative regulatory protein RseB [Actinomycetota bacterium]|jgi:sigma-E factor negative regulatory protein RseB|nr:sigma-E factor negative regulatory protein RseB [Actinomycetota bacterium]
MTRLRLLLLVAGAGTLLAGLPAQAVAVAHPEPTPNGTAANESRAIGLLSAASRAARNRTYAGTQYVSSWRSGRASSSIAEVRHSPAEGAVVAVRPTADGDVDAAVTPTADLDPRLVRLLVTHYALSVANPSTCAGRPVQVVEARHPGGGAVAGRFWIDAATSLLLRRETFDRAGRLVRSSAFTRVDVGEAAPDVVPASALSDQLDASAIDALRRDGWQVPAALAGDLELYDARMRTHDGERVLHLSYSDGLMTLSLFAQRGRLGATKLAGYSRQKVRGAPVWVRPSTPERVVWGGGGRVFTLLSDAPVETVHAAVVDLPHDKAAKKGLLARLGRGLARLGSWLNPFD